MTEELPKPPSYFFHDAVMNKTGYANLEDAKISHLNAINAKDLKTVLQNEGALILDCRNKIDNGFVDGSINVGLNTPFAVWVGTLISAKSPLVLLTDSGAEEEAALRLMRIGFDKIVGYV